MARQKNDGKGRMGGRRKGTPNKVTGTVKEWLADLIDRNRGQIEADLRQLEPKERLAVLEKFMQYIVPKPKTELAVTSDKRQETFMDLSLVPDDVICEIADKLHYSSAAHLSSQFRTVTGLSPSQFKQLKHPRLKPLDEV